MMESPSYELARLVHLCRAEYVGWPRIMPASTVTVESALQLPSDHTLPRPQTQVRHLLPSVVSKQVLLQLGRA
jgi:hypothetical protein